jgi:hypothetical protein
MCVQVCVPAIVSAEKRANRKKGKVVAHNVAFIDHCLILYVAMSTNLKSESASSTMDNRSSRTPRAFG